MIWRYDEAIVDDLNKSFNTDSGTNKPVVAVVPPDDVISIAAQIQDDKITFPIIAVSTYKFYTATSRCKYCI